MRNSASVGGSGRRIIPAPRPPSASAPASSVAVAPIAMTPKSAGVRSLASTRLATKPTTRFVKLENVKKKMPLSDLRLTSSRGRLSASPSGEPSDTGALVASPACASGSLFVCIVPGSRARSSS